MTYIYFINVLGTDIYKIGYTNSLKRRLREIQVGNGQPLTLNYYIEFPTRKEAIHNESVIHSSLEKANMEGEWFNINPDFFSVLENEYDFRASTCL